MEDQPVVIMDFNTALDESLTKIEFLHTLKDKQTEILQYMMSGDKSNIFGILPTGYGKSMLFAIFPFLYEKMRGDQKKVLIICPLRSLMIDQALRWKDTPVRAIALMKGSSVETQHG